MRDSADTICYMLILFLLILITNVNSYKISCLYDDCIYDINKI